MATITAPTTARKSSFVLTALVYAAFISLGLPDALLGVAWHSIRPEFGLPLEALGTLLISTTLAYTITGFNSGRIVAWLGVGKLLAISCIITGSCLLGYSLAPSWWIIVGLGLGAGTGAGAIDAGINTYVAANHSPAMMYWLHASYGIGVTISPLIMTAAIELLGSWRLGYGIVAAVQITLGVCFLFTAKLWKTPEHTDSDGNITEPPARIPLRQTLRMRAAQLSILTFFIYAGSELSAGQWAHTILTHRQIESGLAGIFVGLYWGSFTIGRIMAGFITRRIPVMAWTRISMIGTIIGSLLFWWNPVNAVGVFGLALLGFSLAPIFPSLVASTAQRVGEDHAANTIGFQVGITGFGIAVLPTLAGFLARATSPETIGLTIVIASTAVFLLNEYIMSHARR